MTGNLNAPKERDGFLPIRTNAFDRGFISVVVLILVHLLWMRFLEHVFPLWGATVLCAVLAVVIMRKG